MYLRSKFQGQRSKIDKSFDMPATQIFHHKSPRNSGYRIEVDCRSAICYRPIYCISAAVVVANESIYSGLRFLSTEYVSV